MTEHKTTTLYAVFIIESLTKDDYRDGKTLGEILELSDILKMYRYTNSKAEFLEAIDEFHKSTFRYLHLSCHACTDGIEIGGQVISNAELSRILKGKMNGRRLFTSACKASNRNMATLIISNNGGQSVIGSPVALHFYKSVLFWPSFYQAVSRIDQNKMSRTSLSKALERCVNFFEIPINYYCSSGKGDRTLKRYQFRYNKQPKIEIVSSVKNLK